jgi:hypothetical protein
MHYALAREVYGGECWAIMPSAVQPLLTSFQKEDFDPNKRFNTYGLISALTGEKVSNGGQSNGSKKGKLISETNFNGVVTKTGGASSRGTKEISDDLLLADNDPDVIGHYFQFDGPGGSIAGMDYMNGTLALLTKPKVGLVERSGIAASAHFGMLSQMDYVMAEDGDSEVGSVGVISGAVGHANGATDADGQKHYIVYATKSVHKNEAEETAINSGDTTLLKARADKANEKFHIGIKAKRPAMTDEQMTGKMYKASEVVGTMIDAIGSKQDARSKIIELSKINKNTLTKNNSRAMTASELKAQHPEVYAEIFGAGQTAGIAAENDRIGAWMAHAATDIESVKAGIASGKDISATARETFMVKANSAANLEKIAADSAKDIVNPEAEDKGKQTTEAEALYGPIVNGLKKK